MPLNINLVPLNQVKELSEVKSNGHEHKIKPMGHSHIYKELIIKNH